MVESADTTHIEEGSLEPESGGVHEFLDFEGLCYKGFDGGAEVVGPEVVEHAHVFLIAEVGFRC